MDVIAKLALTLVVGGVFGWLANKIKIPGGFMAGAIVGVGAINILFNIAYMPSDTKTFVQIVAGAFVGCTMEKSDIRRLPKIIKPALLMLLGLLILNMVAGFLIYFVSPLDLVTSLMSVVPGGISDTPIIAADMGADGPKVAIMQMVRQILGIGVFPAMIMFFDKRMEKRSGTDQSDAYKEARQKSKTKTQGAFVCTLVVASVFGLIGKALGIMAGTFVFAIISVLILKLVFDYSYIPRWAKKIAQILSGCYLGSTIVMTDVLELRFLLIPLLIIIIGYALNCLLTGTIISKTCGFTRKEGLLITTPAGASDMALISSDMGVENTDVIILQVVRAVVVMTFFPQIIALIISIIKI